MLIRSLLIPFILIHISVQVVHGQTRAANLPELTQPTDLPMLALTPTSPELILGHVVWHATSQMADIGLILHSQNLHWTAAENGKSKADLTLTSQVIDKHGRVIGGRRQSLSVFAGSQNATVLATVQSNLSVELKLPAEAKTVRFLVQPAFAQGVSASEIDRGNLNAAAYQSPAPQPGPFVGGIGFAPGL
jgi:hypothetical protein